MTVVVRVLAGEDLAAALPALAALRLGIFADYPYLYDGDFDYEADYVRHFAAAPGAVLVAAFAGERIVGVATASPLGAQAEYVRAPFVRAGIDPAGVFYFGESLLTPLYRGAGTGHAFFDHREAAARAWGASHAAFCAVIRPEDHPARPAGYRPLDGFWRKRGYAPVPGVIGEFAWAEHDDPAPIAHPMQVWMRAL